MTYRDRGYLPHLELENSTYFVTFRLTATLPKKMIDEFQQERQKTLEMAKKENRQLTEQQKARLKYLESAKIQRYLDKGIGDCWLKEPFVAGMVKTSIHHFDGTRYVSHALCIMPNHVHWLVTPLQSGLTSRVDSPLSSIMHTIKSYTSHEANKLLKRQGSFWSREYYDHLVRSSEQFGTLLIYVLENPVKAGLCKRWDEWPWTTCSERIRASLIA
jgi:REP element-mobilizing transposase RayT